MRDAGTISAMGLPGWRYATTTDPDERLLIAGMAQQAAKTIDEMQRNQAIHTANEIFSRLKGRG